MNNWRLIGYSPKTPRQSICRRQTNIESMRSMDSKNSRSLWAVRLIVQNQVKAVGAYTSILRNKDCMGTNMTISTTTEERHSKSSPKSRASVTSRCFQRKTLRWNSGKVRRGPILWRLRNFSLGIKEDRKIRNSKINSIITWFLTGGETTSS